MQWNQQLSRQPEIPRGIFAVRNEETENAGQLTEKKEQAKYGQVTEEYVAPITDQT